MDPNFGEAHAWWACAVILGMVYWDTEASSDLLDEALTATDTALSFDDQNAVSYALKARSKHALNWHEKNTVTQSKKTIWP